MPRIPRDPCPDSSLLLARDPYGFIAERCRRYGTDIFQTRLLLRPTICMMGREAAEVFYDASRFKRHGAPPRRVRNTLFGRGAVQGLDGEAHRQRKHMLLDVVTGESVTRLAETTARWWQRSAERWADADQIVLYNVLHPLLTQAVCEWAGVPLDEDAVGQRSRDLTALFDATAAVGPRHWRARFARKRSNRWAGDVVERVRAGTVKPPEGSAAQVIAEHRGTDGQPLPRHAAAVELLNVLRPTVAVSVYIVLGAAALHEHPAWRERIVRQDRDDADLFVQEVRRFYPFFPMVPALVRETFEWKGYRFPKGRRVLLDLYGTNHDPRLWASPHEFRPERFRAWDGDAYNFIPQGGGDVRTSHRCPGEHITIELMKVALRFLAGGVSYDVPDQDLRVDDRRVPALPRSGFVMRNVLVPARRRQSVVDALGE